MPDRLELVLPQSSAGVLVVGDVHGQAILLRAAIDLAAVERRQVVALGDLVDRGPDSAACVRLALALLARGAGVFIRGNHDDKLYRTLRGNPTTVDGDLALTLEQLDAAADSRALKRGFLEAYREAPLVVRLGATIMVHGALAPAMLTSRTLPPRLRALALYGEASPGGPGKKPVRTYGWVDSVPAGLTVVIGHHPISDLSILVRANPAGARVVHLDCGAGKGRGLGLLRLARDGRVEGGLRLVPEGAGVALHATALMPVGSIAAEAEIG